MLLLLILNLPLLAVGQWASLPWESSNLPRTHAPFGRKEGASAAIADGAQPSLGDAALRAGPHRNPRMLFLVSTSPGSIVKAQAIRKTWGARLPAGSDVLFFSHVAAPMLPAIVLPGIECGKDCLGKKEIKIWQWVLDHNKTHGLLQDYDFFVKADDDSFVLPLNMQSFLARRDPEAPCYLGKRFGPGMFGKNSIGESTVLFNAGGATYVLSRGTLKLVAAAAFHGMYGTTALGPQGRVPSGFQWCEKKYGGFGTAGDIAIAHCLAYYGVVPGETRDHQFRERFHCFAPGLEYYPEESMPFKPSVAFNKRTWYYEYSFYGVRSYDDCCSTRSVSYHYIGARDQLMLDGVLYSKVAGSKDECAKLKRYQIRARSRGEHAYPCWFNSKWRDVLALVHEDCTTEKDGPRPPPVHDCQSPARRKQNRRQISDLQDQPGLPKISDFFLHKLQVQDHHAGLQQQRVVVDVEHAGQRAVREQGAHDRSVLRAPLGSAVSRAEATRVVRGGASNTGTATPCDPAKQCCGAPGMDTAHGVTDALCNSCKGTAGSWPCNKPGYCGTCQERDV